MSQLPLNQLPWSWAFCIGFASYSSVQGFRPPTYKVCLSCMSGSGVDSTLTAFVNKVVQRLFVSSASLLSLLTVRCNIASTAIFCRYFHSFYFPELANCMPFSLPAAPLHKTSSHSHSYCVHRIYQGYSVSSFFPPLSLVHFANSLPIMFFSTLLWWLPRQ